MYAIRLRMGFLMAQVIRYATGDSVASESSVSESFRVAEPIPSPEGAFILVTTVSPDDGTINLQIA